MSKSSPSSAPACFVVESDSSAPSSSRQRSKRLRLHEFKLENLPKTSMRDRARAAMVTVRKLCFRLTLAGLNQSEIAEEIDVSLRALLSYKAGVKVPHVVVDALESLVMKVEKKVGE